MSGRATVVWRIARDPALRRVQLAFLGFATAENATWLAVLVYAFDSGGVREAGVVAVVLLVGAVAVAPFAAFAGDRFRPGAALAGGFAVQSATMAATAAAMWADRTTLAYAAAVVASAAITFTRPVVGALLPTVARRPADLIAANVLISAIGDVGFFVGPLAVAAVLTWSDPGAVFAIFAAVVAVCALATVRLASGAPIAADVRPGARSLWGEVTGGVRALRGSPVVAAVIGVLAVGAMSLGVVEVVAVAFADVHLAAGSQAGLLVGAAGLGAMAGSLGASGLIGGARLMPFVLVSGVLLSVPFALLTGISHLVPAVVALAAVGTGQSLMQVAGMVSIQRLAPHGRLARVMGVLEAVQMLSMAAGSAVIALTIDRWGFDTAVVVYGLGLLALVGVTVAGLVAVGGIPPPPPAAVVDRILDDPVLTHLELAALERVAGHVVPVSCPPGTRVVIEGEVGSTYYLVVDGELAVSRAGDEVRRLGSGAAFGEIALLTSVPRTATVTALTTCRLFAVDREVFLEAVTGHATSLTAARRVVDDHLARDR